MPNDSQDSQGIAGRNGAESAVHFASSPSSPSKKSPVVPSPVVLSPKNEPFPQRVAARLTGSPWFWAIFVLTVFGLPLVRSIVRPLPVAPPVLGVFPAFSLVDQTGHAFGSAEVRGQILIAEFVPVTSLMGGAKSPLADLQRRVRNTGD